jgi:hypothetical protein
MTVSGKLQRGITAERSRDYSAKTMACLIRPNDAKHQRLDLREITHPESPDTRVSGRLG